MDWCVDVQFRMSGWVFLVKSVSSAVNVEYPGTNLL